MAGGAAFGVEVGSGFGALAWVDATDGRYETVGLFTTPKYRQLGLGRAAARALIRHILIDRRRQPLWASSVENVPSNGLACSLGMVASISEPLLRCTFEPAAS
jgi:GNAT superfamily N-acetyltransferase